MRKGTARRYDHAQLVHAQWMHVAMMGMRLWIQRVATDDNLADLPSRGEFRQLWNSGAREWKPRMEAFYHSEETWAILQERWRVEPSGL